MHTIMYLPLFLCISILLLYCNVCIALDCKLNDANPFKVAYLIKVDKSGRGNFKTIQSAIDSIPEDNSQWIRIQVSTGIYKEKVIIPRNKPCIFLKGAGSKLTSFEWDDHASTDTSPTFTSLAENIVARGITFKNTHKEDDLVQALAVKIEGDKCAFFECAFVGVQDTLWDAIGRHYFHKCFIQGGVDFIFGNGQSIYEKSTISHSMGQYAADRPMGYITAQGRNSPNDPSGFVFKSCKFIGNGKAYLERAWKAYSRVIISDSDLSEVVVPDGWYAWNYQGQEGRLTYVETNCKGRGANTSKRVPWLKKMSRPKLRHFLDISFINKDGWLAKLPKLT